MTAAWQNGIQIFQLTLKKNVVNVDIWIGKIRTTIPFDQELTLKNWTVVLEEDPDTGDLIMPIPQEVLDLQGWGEGDTLEWLDQGNGSWQLQKKSV